jgi:hypothetical protein
MTGLTPLRNSTLNWHIAMLAVRTVHCIRSGPRDEARKPGFSEQRKLGMRAIIEGSNHSNHQIIQNVSQGNHSENKNVLSKFATSFLSFLIHRIFC